MKTDQDIPRTDDKALWRDLVAFWVLGLCNNYGYVVMLSAANDIIEHFQKNLDPISPRLLATKRKCHFISTGAILLADIMPSMTIKMLAPFLPFWMHARMAVAIACSALGFIFVGFATTEWMAWLGVVVTSFSGGLGETSLLSHSSSYNKNVISTWSSGTGAAGIIGSTSYAGLIALQVSRRNTMLIMLVFPLIEGVSFWILLRDPSAVPEATLQHDDKMIADDTELANFKDKVLYIRDLLHYMLPLVFVYFFEYLINQGLFELVYFDDIFIDIPAQYRWLNVDYQIGVFVSRSSVNVVNFHRVWIMAILQGINFVYFLIEVLYFLTPNIGIVFVIVFWEGLLGGAGYVNTFYRMSKEIPSRQRRFAMAIVAQSDSFGITTAGFLAMPLHNRICSLTAYRRSFKF